MSGVEWNLIGETAGDTQIEQELKAAFDELWQQAAPLDTDLVARYATRAKQAAELRGDWDSEGFSVAGPAAPLVAFAPRPWQQAALDSLAAIRRDGSSKALVAVATLRTALSATVSDAGWATPVITWFAGSSADLSGTLVIDSIQKLCPGP